MTAPAFDKAVLAQRESKYVDFKAAWDPDEAGAWQELVKDIAAMANTGGGYLLFGLDNHGTFVEPCDAASAVDPAAVTDQIARYTGVQFSDFEILSCTRDGVDIPVWRVGSVEPPLVFIRPGTYAQPGGTQKSAFAMGTVYFRHGAKSEPATSQDMTSSFDRAIQRVRAEWLGNVRKVVSAPAGSVVTIASSNEGDVQTAVRLTNDPAAPEARNIDRDKTWPFRQKELIEELNARLLGRVMVNTYDIQCVRAIHDIDGNELFSIASQYGPRQYSAQFLDWLVSSYESDNAFFHHARETYRNPN